MQDPGLVVCLQQPGASQCECMRGSPSAPFCLGACWEIVQKTLCEGEGIHDSGAAAASDGSGRDDGVCDKAGVTERTSKCVKEDPDAVECIRGGGGNCACLRESKSARRCLGSCWPMVEGAVCGKLEEAEPPTPAPTAVAAPGVCDKKEVSV